MKKHFLKVLSYIFTFLFLISVITPSANALYDPLSRPNNMVGMHVLFHTELGETSELVNSNGGEWGYVTVPIQMGDYDIEKWQTFMHQAKEKKIIPIIRLATDPYWANTHVWRKPSKFDLIDMANFLNSLDWPIENRYVIVFNEMNRFDEWGGEPPNPQEYADTFNITIDIFKERNPNFFMIMGGLDNAAPNDRVQHVDVFSYLREMADHNIDVFRKMDGFSSHSYPNPGFEQPPSATQKMSTATYKYEYELIASYAGSPKPVFLTETGWDNSKVSESVIAEYYRQSFQDIWMKDSDKIVAVTPFLLKSHGGFDQFAFIKNENKTSYYHAVLNLNKIAGQPIFEEKKDKSANKSFAVKGVASAVNPIDPLQYDFSVTLKEYFKTLLGL